MADHAVVALDLAGAGRPAPRPRTHWKVEDVDRARAEVARRAAVVSPASYAELRPLLVALQTAQEDGLTSRERRHRRLPLQIRSLLREAALQSCPRRAKTRREEAWSGLQQHLKKVRRAEVQHQLVKGRAIKKCAALKHVKEIKSPDGGVGAWTARTTPEILDRAAQHFFAKWGRARPQLRCEILDFCLRWEEADPGFTGDDVQRCFWSLRQNWRRAGDDVALESLRFFGEGNPSAMARIVNCELASTSSMSSWCVKGRVYGKGAASVTSEALRAILPLHPFMVLCDQMLAGWLHVWLDERFPPQLGCFEGGRKHTQVMDIVGGISLLMERGCDSRGAAACTQADVRSFYDCMQPYRILRQMEREGAATARVAAALRHQMLQQVIICRGDASAIVPWRCVGGLTGTRVAGALGRYPVLDCFAACETVFAEQCFRYDAGQLSAASWVDNLFTVSASTFGSEVMMEAIRAHLWQRWELELKPGSGTTIAAKGQQHCPPVEPFYRRVQSLEAMGHIIERDGGSHSCRAAAEPRLWAAWFRSGGSSEATGVPFRARAAAAGRFCLPGLRFRAVRWPLNAGVLGGIDRLQRSILGTAFRFPRRSHETDREYFRRRGRAIRDEQNIVGSWARQIVAAQCAWRAHLQRARCQHSWALHMFHWHDSRWLQQRRIDRGSYSHLAGRTDTRAQGGYVPHRWQDGLSWAVESGW